VSPIVSLLLGLFLVLLVGALLRRSGRAPEQTSTALNAIILQVTLPALIVSVLSKAQLDGNAVRALLASAIALFGTAFVAWRVGVWRRWSRPVVGSAIMVSSFCNTAFLGVPVIRAAFPDEPSASATAVIIDAGTTGVLMWTFGLVVAQRFGGTARMQVRDSLRQLLLQPTTWALAIAVALSVTQTALPAWLQSTAGLVGGATAPLVFVSLGFSLEFSALSKAGAPLLWTVVLKLLLSPAIAAAACMALSVPSPLDTVAVLQSGMSTAMVGSIVAVSAGCDRALATATAVLTTLLALFTLPLWSHLAG
jgi:predicted permease